MNPKKSENWMKNDLEHNADFDYVYLFSIEYRVTGLARPKTQITTENKIFIKTCMLEIKTDNNTNELKCQIRKIKCPNHSIAYWQA